MINSCNRSFFLFSQKNYMNVKIQKCAGTGPCANCHLKTQTLSCPGKHSLVYQCISKNSSEVLLFAALLLLPLLWSCASVSSIGSCLIFFPSASTWCRPFTVSQWSLQNIFTFYTALVLCVCCSPLCCKLMPKSGTTRWHLLEVIMSQ